MGQWEISFLTGEFHIWPKGMPMLDEHYMSEDLAEPAPTPEFQGADAGEIFSLA